MATDTFDEADTGAGLLNIAPGRYAGAYGYNGQSQLDLTWKCKVDYRGFVSDIDIDRAQSNYGYGYNNGYAPNNNYDYSQYGYRRY